MKLQKSLLLLLSLVLMMSTLGGLAAESEGVLTELVTNPGFEAVTNGQPDDTGVGNGTWGENFFLEEARPMDGKYSLGMKGNGNNILVSWGSTALLDNTDTTFTFYVKRISAASDAIRVTTEFYSEEKVSATAYMSGTNQTEYITNLRDGRWMKQTVVLHIPEGAKRAHAMIRLYGEGEIYIDNVSWTGLCDPERLSPAEGENAGNAAVEEVTELLPPAEGAEELIKNGSFEEAEADGSVINWGCYGNENKWPGNTAICRINDAHSGSYALKVSGSGNPWASQGGIPVEAGKRYQVSCWLKSDGMPGKGFAFKVEGYSGIECDPSQAIGAGDPDTRYYPTRTNGWYHYTDTVIIPEGRVAVIMYARAYGGGTVLVDDVSMYEVNPEVSGDLYCEEVFTYSDREGMTGAWMDLYVEDYPELLEATAEFKITREGATVFSQTVTPDETGRVYAEYSRLVLTEKKVPYLMTVTVKDKEGKEVATDSMNIYKYDRPTRVREDGVYLMDGKPFTPVIAWAPGHTRFAELKAAGMNVVVISYWWSNVEEDPTRLDTILALLEEHDLYGIFGLYINMVPAGHPERINNTKLAVQRLKGHPRVFAYALQDEPTQTVNLAEVEDLMAASYKVVRDIDPDIPVFCVDNSSKYLDVNYRYSDLNCVDPYWQGNGDVTSFPQEMVELMNSINEFDKPTYSLVSAFDWRNAFPTADDTRHNVYQSLFAGAKGVGYYCFEGAWTDAAGNSMNLMDSDRWPTLRKAQLEEYPLLFEHFVYGETPMFNEAKTEDVWYRSWVKDGKIYMAVLSQSDTKDVTVTLPLTSNTGVTVNKFYARVAYGGDVTSIVRDNGAFEYNLKAKQCVLFEIAPHETVDFSSLFAPKFDDLYNYDWARMQIEELAKDDIVIGRAGVHEQGYLPQDAITRADFAMYLVRAMGLVSNIQVSFADINSNSYYAAELAAGKLDGILQGVGDNKFNPDGLITREDMIVMVARGLELSGSGDLSAFPDGAETSDYATGAVSAMVEKGLIKGDSLGNLNPKGNTTRAEAAVFIHRLLESGVIKNV